METVVT